MTRLNTEGQVWKAIALTGIALAVAGVMGTIVFGAQARSATQTGSPPPTTIPYQGHLLDADGDPVADGTYAITFTLWNSPTLGTRLWGPETHASVSVSDGYFAVTLGTTETLSAGVLETATYLEIEVEGEVLSPRQRLGAVPFALKADTVSGVEAARQFMILNPLGTTSAACIGPTRFTGLQVASMPWNEVGTLTGNHDLGWLTNGTPYFDFDGSTVIWWTDSAYNGMRNTLGGVAWVQPDRPPQTSGEFIMTKYASSSDWAWYLNRRSNAVPATSGTLQFCVRNGGGSSGCVSSDTSLDSGNWYFVAFRYNASTDMTVYWGDADGNFDSDTASSAGIGQLADSNASYTFSRANGSIHFGGKMLLPPALMGGGITDEWIEEYYHTTLVLVQ